MYLTQSQPTMLSEADWKRLLERIQEHKCTPFPDVQCTGSVMPSRSSITARWAAGSDFPVEDSSDLAHVAQSIVTKEGDGLGQREKTIDFLVELKQGWDAFAK